MSLSTEEKQLYAVFIHNVYNGAVHADADDITPEVADICDKLATAIAQCSKKKWFGLRPCFVHFTGNRSCL